MNGFLSFICIRHWAEAGNAGGVPFRHTNDHKKREYANMMPDIFSLKGGVKDGARTHDPWNHNPML